MSETTSGSYSVFVVTKDNDTYSYCIYPVQHISLPGGYSLLQALHMHCMQTQNCNSTCNMLSKTQLIVHVYWQLPYRREGMPLKSTSILVNFTFGFENTKILILLHKSEFFSHLCMSAES